MVLPPQKKKMVTASTRRSPTQKRTFPFKPKSQQPQKMTMERTLKTPSTLEKVKNTSVSGTTLEHVSNAQTFTDSPAALNSTNG